MLRNRIGVGDAEDAVAEPDNAALGPHFGGEHIPDGCCARGVVRKEHRFISWKLGDGIVALAEASRIVSSVGDEPE